MKISFDKSTTELDALQRAAYAVADLMTVDVRASATDYICALFPRRAGLDEKETEPIRNLIFALAFSETGLAEGEKTDK